MTYGSETWPLKVEYESRLEKTDMRMIRWMCGEKIQDGRRLGPPSWILVTLNITGNSPCWSEVGQQIVKESVERFKIYGI
jgi:hypothetical protein